MPRVILRPTLPQDLPFLIGEPLPCRIRAITAVLSPADEEADADDHDPSAGVAARERPDGPSVIGIGGIAFPPEGPAWAFVQQAPEAKQYPLAFHRAGLMAMQMIRELGLREVVATADADNPTALRWLRRLGFVESDRQDIEGKLLFVLKRQTQLALNGREARGPITES
jgi:RimJ/RimL family protein N-acetyltransferase